MPDPAGPDPAGPDPAGPDVTGPNPVDRDPADPARSDGPLAGEPRERALDLPWARRVGSWLIWWVLMMSFWIMLDDSVATDELLAGAGAAAIAASLAEVVSYQAASRFRMRAAWLVPALRLPGSFTVSSRPARSSNCPSASGMTRQQALPAGRCLWAGPASRLTPSCSAWTPSAM
jgi:hypothetical protein